MNISFATCCRKTALEYIQWVYPNRSIEDSPKSIGLLLDLVSKDVIRIQDPMMYGNRIGVVEGKKFSEKYRDEIMKLTRELIGGEK